MIPIFDTDVCYLNSHSVVASTGYGDIREYDTRDGKRRPVINAQLGKGTEKLLLSKVAKSHMNENLVFTVNQEGHIIVIDRRKSYQIVRKLVGNRGSVRALSTVMSKDGLQEFVVSAGCDRHVRLFDPNCDL